eukprot:tig00000404_g424.t1
MDPESTDHDHDLEAATDVDVKSSLDWTRKDDRGDEQLPMPLTTSVYYEDASGGLHVAQLQELDALAQERMQERTTAGAENAAASQTSRRIGIDEDWDIECVAVPPDPKRAQQGGENGGRGKGEVDLDAPEVVRDHLEHEFRFLRLNLKRARLFNLTYTRIKLTRELVLFVLFLLLFYATVIMLMPLSRAYEHSGQLSAKGGLLNLEPVPGQKVSETEAFPFFMASNTIEDVYKWMREVLIPLLTPADGESEIYGRFQRPLASIDIRQLQQDYIDTYGEGGYVHVIDVAIDRKAGDAMEVRKRAQDEIQALQDARWIDDNTRAAAISFALYNKHTNIYTIAELLLEMPTSGFIIPSHSVRPVYIFLAANRFQNIFLAIYAGWVIAIVFGELFEMARQRLDYFMNFWNLIETLLCCLHAYLGYKFVLYYDYSTNVFNAITLEQSVNYRDAISNLQKIRNMNRDVSDVAGVMVVIYGFRLFKYFRIEPQLYILWSTIVHAWRPIIGFVFVILLLFAAFALAGMIVFGFQVLEFRNFTESYANLFRFLLGDFDYPTWADTSRGSGVVFFISGPRKYSYSYLRLRTELRRYLCCCLGRDQSNPELFSEAEKKIHLRSVFRGINKHGAFIDFEVLEIGAGLSSREIPRTMASGQPEGSHQRRAWDMYSLNSANVFQLGVEGALTLELAAKTFHWSWFQRTAMSPTLDAARETYFNQRRKKELEWSGIEGINRAGRGLGHFLRRLTRHYLISQEELEGFIGRLVQAHRVMKEWKLNAVMAEGDLTFENDSFGSGDVDGHADAWVNVSGAGVVGNLDQWAVNAVLEVGKDEIELDQ